MVDRIKFLGSWIFPLPGAEEDEYNYSKVTDKMRLAYRSWAWRKPSPLGAAMACQSLVVSTAIHILHNFIPPTLWIAETNKLMRKFIWSGGRAHIRMSRLQAPTDLGGLNMVNLYNLQTSLKVFWFRKLVMMQEDSMHFNWMKILNIHLKRLELDITIITTLGHKDYDWIADKFHTTGLQFWSDTFRRFATAARLLEESTVEWQSLPIFGGIFQERLKNRQEGHGYLQETTSLSP